MSVTCPVTPALSSSCATAEPPVTNRSKGLLFVKDPDRGLGEFEYVLNDDEVTLWTIPRLSDHVGFLRLQSENRSFALQRPDRGQRLDLIITNVKPSGDRFELTARILRQAASG